jgi:hypothetical protein
MRWPGRALVGLWARVRRLRGLGGPWAWVPVAARALVGCGFGFGGCAGLGGPVGLVPVAARARVGVWGRRSCGTGLEPGHTRPMLGMVRAGA